jgi:hypothetical protein
VTHHNNPSGSDQLLIPSNDSDQLLTPSNTAFQTTDIATAYTYGELYENYTTTENGCNNMEFTTGNPNEYYQQQAPQNSSTNSNQLEQYSTDSVTTYTSNPIK